MKMNIMLKTRKSECRCWRKFSPASLDLLLRRVHHVSQASAFCYHGHSGTASQGLIQEFPAMSVIALGDNRWEEFNEHTYITNTRTRRVKWDFPGERKDESLEVHNL
jgi:hypothetical protein